MMRKEWIDPSTIYLAKPMNPRPLNQGFIESLRESMEAQGFLPQYPVKVFEADRLTCVKTDLQYACVSGMHRTTYCVEHYDFPGGENLAEKFKAYLKIVEAVQRDISEYIALTNAGALIVDSHVSAWVAEFRQQMDKDTLAKRQKIEEDWVKAKRALADALTKYPRNIAPTAFCLAMDDEFYERSGTHFKLFSRTEISSRVHNDTLKSQIKHFKQAAKDLAEDAKWVRAIAEEPVPEDTQSAPVDLEVANALFFVKLLWKQGDETQMLVFENNPLEGARDISDLPDSLRQHNSLNVREKPEGLPIQTQTLRNGQIIRHGKNGWIRVASAARSSRRWYLRAIERMKRVPSVSFGVGIIVREKEKTKNERIAG